MSGCLLAILIFIGHKASADDLVAIQECLTFTQFYLGLADGNGGPMTDRAIRSFQRSLQETETGILTPSQSSRLFASCNEKKHSLGWAPFRFRTGTIIDLPLGVVQQKSESVGKDVATFEGLEGDLVLVAFAIDPASVGTLDNFHSKAVELAIERTYLVRKDNWFVVSGTVQDGSFVYSYARLDGQRLFGYTMVWSRRVGLLVGGTQVMILNSFKRRNFGPGPAPGTGTGTGTGNRLPYSAPPAVASESMRPSPTPQGLESAGSALPPAEIFKRTRDSVWVLISASLKGDDVDWDDVAQGSAVAIAPDRLFTNCHTLAHHSVHIIAQKTLAQPLTVTIARADYEHDKCVPRSEKTLPAFVSIRRFDTVEIGEDAYSIGAPQGLDLTIANGIVSGKRVHNGTNYLQTTAPISPGSSGGGLFDARARLIGITTMFLAEAQNLNFAIAADEF